MPERLESQEKIRELVLLGLETTPGLALSKCQFRKVASGHCSTTARRLLHQQNRFRADGINFPSIYNGAHPKDTEKAPLYCTYVAMPVPRVLSPSDPCPTRGPPQGHPLCGKGPRSTRIPNPSSAYVTHQSLSNNVVPGGDI